MAQTVQRRAASGSKRKAPEASSDPPTPAAKKAKTATARKSTGGRPPRRSNGAEQATSAAGRILSTLCFSRPFIVIDDIQVNERRDDTVRGQWLFGKFESIRRVPIY
jgi:hypothetical protein